MVSRGLMPAEPTPEERNATLAAELEESSEALMVSLQRRDPSYLEHLQKRHRLVEELSSRLKANPDSGLAGEMLPRLNRACAAGARSLEEAMQMRDSAREEMARLLGYMRLARGLDCGSVGRSNLLNLKG